MKSSNLRHRQDLTQNKGLNRTSQLQTIPPLVTGSQSRKGAIETLSTKLQAGFFANQDFLGFWTPRKPSGRDGEALSHSDRARQTPHHLSCSDLGRAQIAGPTESAPLRTTRVPEPEQLRPGGTCSSGPALDGSHQSNLGPEQCGQGGHMHRERGQAQCG